MNWKFIFEITYVESNFKSLFVLIDVLMFFVVDVIWSIVCDLFNEINETIEIIWFAIVRSFYENWKFLTIDNSSVIVTNVLFFKNRSNFFYITSLILRKKTIECFFDDRSRFRNVDFSFLSKMIISMWTFVIICDVEFKIIVNCCKFSIVNCEIFFVIFCCNLMNILKINFHVESFL